MAEAQPRVEWPTLLVLVATYVIWVLAVFWMSQWSLFAAIVLVVLTVAQQSSLQHEALHGHPFRVQWLNALLVRASLNLAIPYGRFRDTHLAHHRDTCLTDPYDDPETNFLAEGDWNALPVWLKAVYRVNNSLAGRMLLGPALGQWSFMRADLGAGGGDIARSWAAHLVSSAMIIWAVVQSQMPLWAYILAAYLGLSILKIRTFLEHRAEEQSRERSVIIEDRGLLSFLFLNNNLHAVHHMHPAVAWYHLPTLYRGKKERFLAYNGGYVYRSYGAIFARFMFRAKDPVAHPLWHRIKEKLDA